MGAREWLGIIISNRKEIGILIYCPLLPEHKLGNIQEKITKSASPSQTVLIFIILSLN